MLTWLHSLALIGLLAAAGPIAVHLLRRQRAARLPFASLRFVRAASTAAVRLRLPSDLWLLALRVAIVCGAAVALAQPILVTAARQAAWNARVSRAIVVDTSASMASSVQRAMEAATAEAQGTAYAVRVDADRLRVGVLRAVDALRAAPPTRREIVVISDFQNGSLSTADLASVPREFGLRFTGVGAPAAAREFRGDVALGAPGVEARVQHIQPTPDGTSVLVRPTDTPTEGLRLLDAGPAGDALLRAVARAGAPAGSAGQPLAFAFTTTLPQNLTNLTNPTNPVRAWMLRTVLAMRRDPSLAEAAREHRRPSNDAQSLDVGSWGLGADKDRSMVVARDANDAPLVLAASDGTELVVLVAGLPGDYLAAATLRSALIARRGEPDWGEHEVEQVPAVQLAGWTRQAGPFETTWPNDSEMAPGDARGVWLLVIALLGAETFVRRRRPRVSPVPSRVASEFMRKSSRVASAFRRKSSRVASAFRWKSSRVASAFRWKSSRVASAFRWKKTGHADAA